MDGLVLTQRTEVIALESAPILPSDPTFVIADVVVAFNSCPECAGNRVCRTCKGARSLHFPTAEDPEGRRDCPVCDGKGVCDVCQKHFAGLRQFALEFALGSLGVAEACLQRELIQVAEDEQRARTNLGIGGAGIGAVLGTIIAPGLGTIVGLSLGKMLGDKAGEGETLIAANWKRADLLYCLGVLYATQGRKGEATQAFIKTLTLNERHEAAKAALREAL